MMSEPIKIIPSDGNSGAIAILPGQFVSFFSVELPGLSTSKLEKILPGVMTDLIASDIQDVHLSIIEKKNDGEHLISVCDLELLKRARNSAVEEGKLLKAIWPDYALLEVPDEDISIMHLSDRVLARRADGSGFNVKKNMLKHVIGNCKFTEVFESRSIPNGIGLASGEFSARAPFGNYIHALKRLAVVSVVGMLLWVMFSWLAISNMEQEWNRYQNASVALLKQTYPQVTRVVNVEAQMRALSTQSNTAGGADFISHADLIFKAVGEVDGLTIESLSFDASEANALISVSISSLNYSQANLFESNLTQEGYHVTQGESSQTADNIFTSYVLRENTND